MKRYLEFINEQVFRDWNLTIFARDGDLEGVKRVLDKGVDIHGWGDLALRIASESGHLDIIKYLVEQGANIHAQNDQALLLSSLKGHLEIVKYLCELIIQNEPWHIPKIIKYVPNDLKEKYDELIDSMLSAGDMDLL